MLNRKQLESCI